MPGRPLRRARPGAPFFAGSDLARGPSRRTTHGRPSVRKLLAQLFRLAVSPKLDLLKTIACSLYQLTKSRSRSPIADEPQDRAMARQFPPQLLFFTHIIGTIGRVNRLRERTNRVTPSGLPGWVSQRSASLGALSLIFWTLIIVAAVKIRAFDHESRQPRRRRHSRLAGACSRIGTKRAFARHPCPPRPRRCRIILRRQPLALFLFQKHRQRGSTPASQCRCLRENPFFRMVLHWGLFPLVLLSSQS